jgi:hypothetical protein
MIATARVAWCPEGDLNPHSRFRPADFKSDFDETAGECRSLHSSRKSMIPGLIMKDNGSQAIAGHRSKFRNEVSPEVSPKR